MAKISVIIPVYNGEKYIRSCLDSVIKQTFKDFEVIVVDDASTDKTSKILEEYVSKYSNIKIFTQEKNLGQGKARNTGIDISTGETIIFVDSDDTINLDMLEKMNNIMQEHEADIVVCDYYEITKESKVLKKAIPNKTSDIKKDYIAHIAGPCNKLIKSDIIKKNKLYFTETGAYEDISIIPLIGIYSKKIVYLEEPLYNYYIRKGSTMRQNEFSDKLLSIYDVLENLSDGFKKSGLDYNDEIEYIYIKHLLYAGIGRFLEYKDGKKEVKKIVKIIKERFPNWRNNKYYKTQSFLFKLNCNIFYTNCLAVILPFRKTINHLKNRKSTT